LAASSASRVGNIVEEVLVPVHDSVQPVAVETQSTNNAILETIRSCQPDQMGFQTVLTLLSKAVSQCQFIYMAEMARVSVSPTKWIANSNQKISQ